MGPKIDLAVLLVSSFLEVLSLTAFIVRWLGSLLANVLKLYRSIGANFVVSLGLTR